MEHVKRTSWATVRRRDMILGSFHQGDMTLFSRHAGKQCVANCVAALIKSNWKEIRTWTTADLDHILLSGDALYGDIVKQNDLLLLSDIPNIINLFAKEWMIGVLHETECAIASDAIYTCLQTVFHHAIDVIVMVGSVHGAAAMAMKDTGVAVYLFDPHSRSGVTGLQTADGQSVCIKFSDRRSVANFILEISMQLHADQVSFGAIKIDSKNYDGYICTKCSKQFVREGFYKRHVMSCKGSTAKQKQLERKQKSRKQSQNEDSHSISHGSAMTAAGVTSKTPHTATTNTTHVKQEQSIPCINLKRTPEKEKNKQRMQKYRADCTFTQNERIRDRKRKRSNESKTIQRETSGNDRMNQHICINESNASPQKIAEQDVSVIDATGAANDMTGTSVNENNTSCSSLDEAITVFLQSTRDGPIYVCTSCQQTMFRDDVDPLTALRPRRHCDLLEKCVTGYVSVDGIEWLCHSCKRDIYNGLYPKMSIANKCGFPERPPELILHPLEETLIAPLLPFMTIRSLPVGGLIAEGQKLVVGNVVHVPNNIESTVDVLPRQLDDMGTIAVKLKRRKSQKTAVFQEVIRPARCLKALQFLKQHSVHYDRVICDVDWMDKITNSTSENTSFVEGMQSREVDSLDDAITDETCEDNFDEVPITETIAGNLDTILDENDPIQVYQDAEAEMNNPRSSEHCEDEGHRVYNLAPGEGQVPVFRDASAEYKCFPTIFCGAERPKNEERHRPISMSMIFKAELRSIDPRVCLNIPNIFWKATYIKCKQVISKCHLALRKIIGSKTKDVTAKQLLDPGTRDAIRRLDEGYRIFRSVRHSPPYFEHRKKEVNAMIRQLGYPSVFFSLSAADTHWKDLIRCLALLVNGDNLTDDEIEHSLTFQQKCKLVSSHPTVCSRFFHHRVQKFINLILTGDHAPVGTVSDFFYRVEFQKRGSPHIHGFLWIKDAPNIQNASDEEICKYVDSCMSCSSNVPDHMKQYLKLQLHSHNRSCKRKQGNRTVCRFGAPWPPMEKTQVLYPIDNDCDNDFDTNKKKLANIMEMIKKLPDNVNTHEEWLAFIGMTSEQYIMLIRSTIHRRKLFMKRSPRETRINVYMKGLLHAWQANHDVQFVLNPYQCVSYICDYMTKSQKGISELMQAANDEVRTGNMNLKESVRHIGNKFVNAAESPIQQCCYDILSLPITNSTRKKEFINTSPPELRVGLAKSMETLRQMKPDSKQVTMLSNIDRYSMRPKFLESWCLAEYVAKTDIEYPKKSATHPVCDDDDEDDPESREDCEQNETFAERDGFPYVLRNGLVLRLRTKNKIIRFRRYSEKNDPENYYREMLMLYVPWRKESELIGIHSSYAGAFAQHAHAISERVTVFEPYSAELDAAWDELHADTNNDTNIEQNDQGESDDTNEATDMPVIAPDRDSLLFRVDIGAALGIPPTQHDQDEEISQQIKLSDSDYYKLLAMLNKRQQEFHTHITHQALTSSTQTLVALHGGAGTGKSTVINAISESLRRILTMRSGEDFEKPVLCLMAPTGKAAYNIGGETIHRALFVPASQRLEYKALKWDVLNTIRSKFHGISWIIIDEFSMVGKRMINFINLRMQEIFGTQQLFGGINVLLVGDLHQLQPVKDGWIFEDMDGPYGALAPNVFKDNFSLFELDEIMRQRDDKHFAEVLNRIRCGKQTTNDITFLKTRCISEERSLELPNIPHFYTTNEKKDHYNMLVMQETDAPSVTVEGIDVVQSDIPKSEQRKALGAAKIKPTSASGNLPHILIIKVGVKYDVTANISPRDGIVNGAECVVRNIGPNMSDGLPQFVWVEFLDSNVGKDMRRQIRSTYEEFVSKKWTPIQPITRTFVATRNNYHITRKQFPLQMSSGRTIHKAQSATHTNIVVDLSGPDRAPPNFWQHMHYVALSRCTKLDGLNIIDLNEKKMCTSPKVLHYLQHDRLSLSLCFSPSYNHDSVLNIIYHNVGSIYWKWPAIKSCFNIMSADVIIFAETWLTGHHNNRAFDIDGFNTCRFDSHIQSGHRGLLMLWKENLHISTPQNYQSQIIELISCCVHKSGHTFNIIGVYKPPSSRQADFLSELSNYLDKFDTDENIILIGDMNIDISHGQSANFLKYMKQYYSLVQRTQTNTTWDNTQIDLVFTNFINVETSVLTTMWSKHHLLTCTIEHTTS